MKIFKALATGSLLIALGACTTTYIEDHLSPIRAMSPQGGPFNAGLHKSYLEVADKEHQGRDLSDTLYYGEKARRAAAGEEVLPEDPNTLLGPGPILDEANGYHRRLLAALDGNARTTKFLND